MAPIILGLVFTTVTAATVALVARHKREWAGYWRGQHIYILQTAFGCTVSANGHEIAQKDRWYHNRISATHSDPVHGEVSVELALLRDSSGVVAQCQLVMDGEIVHLVQAPSDFLGRAISENMPQLKEISTVEGTTITDPRYAAAERLMTSIQAELTDDPTTSELISTLHGELSRHILVAQRLLQSKSDYAALGNDSGHMDAAQRVTEARIKKLLTALQDIHLSVVQRNMSAAAPVLSEARNVIAQIRAEAELEQTLADGGEQAERDTQAQQRPRPQSESTKLL